MKVARRTIHPRDSVNCESTSSGSGEVYIDQQEKIMAKITDLGNGARLFPLSPSSLYLFYLFAVASLAARVLFSESRARDVFQTLQDLSRRLPFPELAPDFYGRRRWSLMSTVSGVWSWMGMHFQSIYDCRNGLVRS